MKVSYEDSFFRSDELQIWAELYLKHIPEDVDIIVSRGSSGCSIASAILAISTRSFDHAHIRKTDEHHGGTIYTPKKGLKGVIVDDFISTGGTINTIIEKCEEWDLPIKAILVSHVINDIKNIRLPEKYKSVIIKLGG